MLLNPANYKPPQTNDWQGRDSDACEYFYQTVNCVDINKIENFSVDTQQTNYAMIGFAVDEGVRRNQGRIGAKEGPAAIRQVLTSFALPEKLSFKLYDVGDIVCVDEDLEQAQASLSSAIKFLCKQDIKPIVIGGGHELAFGHYCGLTTAQDFPAIINIDAHYDMRPCLKGSLATSGSGFLQIANLCEQNKKGFYYLCMGIQKTANPSSVIATASQHQVITIPAATIHLNSAEDIHESLALFLQGHSTIYLSVCLDVFAQSVAPGVSAPSALGLTVWQVLPFLHQIVATGKVKGFDIAEYAPKYDIDARTAKLAASLIYEYLLRDLH